MSLHLAKFFAVWHPAVINISSWKFAYFVGSEVHFCRVKVENRSIIRLAVKYSTRFGTRRSIRFTFLTEIVLFHCFLGAPLGYFHLRLPLFDR